MKAKEEVKPVSSLYDRKSHCRLELPASVGAKHWCAAMIIRAKDDKYATL